MGRQEFSYIHSKENVILKSHGVVLRKFKESDYTILKELLKDDEYVFYFCLKQTDDYFLKEYVKKMIKQMEMRLGIAYIIEKKGLFYNTPVGYIVGNYIPLRSPFGDEVVLNINFAVLPQFRNKGYATNAIKAVIQPYSSTPIMKIVMDIADSNEASNNVAMKLEFLKEANNPMYDKQNPLIGAHYKWFNTIPYMIKIFGKN